MKYEISNNILIRYGLTGAFALICYVFVPCYFFNKSILRELNSSSGILLIIGGALICGHLLDNLKAYRFTFGYKKGKNIFINQISTEFKIEFNEALFLLSKASDIEKKDKGDIFNLHIRWMHNLNCIFICYSSSMIWFVIIIYDLINFKIEVWYFLILLSTIIIGIRLNFTANQEQRRINKMYIEFIRENCDKLKLHKKGEKNGKRK